MQILDNVSEIVRDDLKTVLNKGSRVSIAAACFSIYAYQELKNELENVEELRFIFTSPTFVKEKTSKASREFYIPRLTREKCLYGTEFEVKLRNELTQKAIAKECSNWISRKAVFRSNVTQEQMMSFMTVDESTYMPINGFTTVDLGCERGNEWGSEEAEERIGGILMSVEQYQRSVNSLDKEIILLEKKKAGIDKECARLQSKIASVEKSIKSTSAISTV